jgi:ketosteroid isomerase-like protein
MMRRSLVITVMPAVLALTLAACGESDEDESEKDKARSVASLIAERDPAVCDVLTKKFVDEIFKRIETCKTFFSRAGTPKEWGVKKVTIQGKRATAIVSRDGEASLIKLLRQDGDWRIAGTASADTVSEQDDGAAAPRIQEGLDARATVDAYLQAIDDEDGAALCGLLSERYATEVLGEGERPDPIGDCVKELQNFDWTDAHKSAAGVTTGKVIRSHDTTTVTLTSGKRALLEKDEGRWVINDIKG